MSNNGSENGWQMPPQQGKMLYVRLRRQNLLERRAYSKVIEIHCYSWSAAAGRVYKAGKRVKQESNGFIRESKLIIGTNRKSGT
ncbi:MAG: hypothetical protein K0S39_3701 [Paenibacillus sp.]|jgi:hypothetical protein|nr:hypothetical protein [Paenibacillus sp.]